MSKDLESYIKCLRIKSKAEENRRKPPIISPDVVQTTDFVFSKELTYNGDSGKLLLAKKKNSRAERYLVKHAYTDSACNEYVYTKLAQAMGYCMPEAVLFQLSNDEKRHYFKTEYIIGLRYLNVVKAFPSYDEIRVQAINWSHYFSFYGLYGMTNEDDGVELLLADDRKIYRVDTTDAFPISNYQLDMAGINQEISGINPYIETRKQLLNNSFENVLSRSNCDYWLEKCLEINQDSLCYFLEPFSRIQEIPTEYIDDFLNTLCYFYPDYIGDYFKRYISALQKQCAVYLKEKR